MNADILIGNAIFIIFAFCNFYFLSQGASDFKADLSELSFTAARELDLDGARKAIIAFVPFRQLKDFHKVQPRLIRELEKKFR